MQMHEAKQVVQVVGAGNANSKLAEGWTLLAVVSADVKNGGVSAMYVLGRAEPASPQNDVKITAADLARANSGL
ncbi:hypothetical protein ACLIN3_27340 (plasmid) [Pseudomonas orientalis]|uniref:hypothetical protein n=1 Tax=Pseudomonas orientalis TaxID=76758 RepID=UPI0039886E6F